jgi:hypothetical protein
MSVLPLLAVAAAVVMVTAAVVATPRLAALHPVPPTQS